MHNSVTVYNSSYAHHVHVTKYHLSNTLDLTLFIIDLLSLLMSTHDDSGHDKEANVSQEDQYHWNSEGPDE